MPALKRIKIYKNFSFRRNTRFGFGGFTKYYCVVRNKRDLVEALKFSNQNNIPYFVIGSGTNILPPSGRKELLVVKNKIEYFRNNSNSTYEVGSGNNLDKLIDRFNLLGLSGLEKMAGIPGTVGGAIRGNAGAYGQEIKNVVDSVYIFDGVKFGWLSKRGCLFRYRESVFKNNPQLIIISVKLRLKRSKPELIKKISREIRSLRFKKYPKNIKCAGSYFKNILLRDILDKKNKDRIRKEFKDSIKNGKVPAGKIIDFLGLRGKKVGGVKISDHHGNLVVNLGNGTPEQVATLAKLIKDSVLREFKLKLEEEVVIV